MNDQKQYETMATLRAYAQEIAQASPRDLRPSVASGLYAYNIKRMAELVRSLDVIP